MKLASRLRAKNIPVDIDLIGKQLKKQMESASHSKFAIIIGPKELEQNLVVLRNMNDRTESQINVDELLDNPENYL